MIELDVARAVACQDAIIRWRERAIVFETPASRWAYAVWFEIPTAAPPWVAEITMGADVGCVGVACIDASTTRFVSGEGSVVPSDGTLTRRLLVESHDARTLVFRNLADGASIGRIERICLRAGSAYSPVELKRMRADRYPYWHYSFDLGDGVRTTATLDSIMAVHDLNQRIMFRLMCDHFEPVRIETCLDAACNSGYHAFALARRGMSVVGIDTDELAIEQARLVQALIDDPAVSTVRFRCQDLMSLPATERYDLVFCSGLFYHLRDLVGGARQIANAARVGAVVHTFVSNRDGDVLELANSEKYVCCSPGEFSFVPTAGMLEKTFATSVSRTCGDSPRSNSVRPKIWPHSDRTMRTCSGITLSTTC